MKSFIREQLVFLLTFAYKFFYFLFCFYNTHDTIIFSYYFNMLIELLLDDNIIKTNIPIEKTMNKNNRIIMSEIIAKEIINKYPCVNIIENISWDINDGYAIFRASEKSLLYKKEWLGYYLYDIENQKISGCINDYNNINKSTPFLNFYVNSCFNVISVKIIDLSNLFDYYRCSNNFKTMDLSKWDTSNVINMSGMFQNCSKLENINMSYFNTSNVTNMSNMFKYCYSIDYIDLSMFDTSNVTNMSNMFYGCKQLKKIKISNINTSNVKDMCSMFYNCEKLRNVFISRWITNNLIDISYMFYNCKSINKINIKNFDINNIENVKGLFYGCNNLKYINLSSNNSNINTTILFNK